VLGRYVLSQPIGAGGMASVHLARWVGKTGLSRTVAVKRLHPNLAADPEFAAMFLDEARIATRIRHVNVIPTLDVASQDGAVFLVMEYVPGESLANLERATRAVGARIPVAVAAGIVAGVLEGLHAAHEAQDENGAPLGIVHRDVSPHNVLVGVDGIARLLDFGIAKALGKVHTTRADQLKGKMGYIAPEQLKRGVVDRRTDVFTAAVVLWEAIVGERLFEAPTDAETIYQILERPLQRPSAHVAGIPQALDDAVMRGLERDPTARYATAYEMARAIRAAVRVAPPPQVGEWLATVAHDRLAEREVVVREMADVAFSPTLRELAGRVRGGTPVALRGGLAGAAPSAEGETKTLKLRAIAAPTTPTTPTSSPSRAPAVRPSAPAPEAPRPVRAADPPVEGFGEPPVTFLGAAAYAVRVLGRRAAIERALAEGRAALTAAQEGRRDALVQFVESLPIEPDPSDPLSPWLVPLHRYRTGPTDPSQQPFELAWAADVDEALAAVLPRKQAADAQLREYADLHERLAGERSRAEARHKRADIERRAAETAARASGRPPAFTGPAADEHAALAAEIAALRADEARALAARDAAQSRFDAVAAEVAELERQKERLVQRGAQRLAEMRGFREGDKRDAFVRAGEQILDWCPASVPDAARAALAAADAAIVAARARLDEIETVHAAFAPEVHRRGMAVLGGLLGVAVLVLLVLAFVGRT
jgi:serine/threonine-protein kinase